MVENVYIVQGYQWDLKKFEVTSENQQKYEVTNGNFPTFFQQLFYFKKEHTTYN